MWQNTCCWPCFCCRSWNWQRSSRSAAEIGFVPALALTAAGSMAGTLILQNAAAITSPACAFLSANLAGQKQWRSHLVGRILLLIPGFITDARWPFAARPTAPGSHRRSLRTRRFCASCRLRGRLAAEQWRRVLDPELPDHRGDGRKLLQSLFPLGPYVSQPPARAAWPCMKESS